MNSTYNEHEVLALLQDEKTQRRGFEMVVAQYSEQLYWQIRRMVYSHEDTNDLLQNTFIKAWLNIDYFRGDAKLSTWLYMAAMFVGAALIIRVASSRVDVPTDGQQSHMAEEMTDSEMEYIDAVINNSMLDDYSLYVYLTDEKSEE